MARFFSFGLLAPSHRLAAAAAAGIALYYLLALDQGWLLSLVQGDVAYVQNLVHETLHDARHAAGFPCH